MTNKCTHRAIRSWSQLDGSPVEMWSCVDCGWRFEPVRERQPLTDDEIRKLWDSHTIEVYGKIGINPVLFARYLEREYGIGEKE